MTVEVAGALIVEAATVEAVVALTVEVVAFMSMAVAGRGSRDSAVAGAAAVGCQQNIANKMIVGLIVGRSLVPWLIGLVGSIIGSIVLVHSGFLIIGSVLVANM